MVDEKISASTIATIILIISIIALSFYILMKDNPSSSLTEEEAICIGNNSELYVQTGCGACVKQEELFGENLVYIKRKDCFLKENWQLCINKGIDATPTWIIKEEKYTGVQSIEKLKKLTDCTNGD